MRVAIAQYEGPSTFRALPLAAGILAATLRRVPDLGDVAIEIHRHRIDPEAAAQALAEVDVLGLSLYTWNERYALEVARRVKALDPEVLIVAGGPSVPRRPDDLARYLHASPALDALVAGEGERVFVDIVRARREQRPLTHLPGVAVRDGAAVVQAPRGPRLGGADFATPAAPAATTGVSVGSPYLDGTFAALLDEPGAAPITSALFETNRGCPFSCTFCDWGAAIESKVHELPIERVLAELRWAAERRIEFFYLIDANFGIRRRDLDIVHAIGDLAATTGYPRFVYFHLTKNATDKNLATVEALRRAGIGTQVALSMQDFDPDVLAAIRRDNIHPERALELRARAHAEGLPTSNELLLGLPAQTAEGFRRSLVQALTPFPGDSFSLYMTRILVNAELADPAYRERWGIFTREVPSLPRNPTEPVHVVERELVVVGSHAMSVEAWREAFVFGYLLSALANQGLLATTLRVLRFVLDADVVAFVDALLRAPTPRLAAVRAMLERFADAVLAGEATTLALEGYGPTRREPVEGACAAALEDAPGFFEEVRAVLHARDAHHALVDDAVSWDALQVPEHRAPAGVVASFTHDWEAWALEPSQPPPASRLVVRRHLPVWVGASPAVWLDTFLTHGWSRVARVALERR